MLATDGIRAVSTARASYSASPIGNFHVTPGRSKGPQLSSGVAHSVRKGVHASARYRGDARGRGRGDRGIDRAEAFTLAEALPLKAAGRNGVTRAVLFTENPAARRSYDALRFRQIGKYGITIYPDQ
jgi:hypothetical protein